MSDSPEDDDLEGRREELSRDRLPPPEIHDQQLTYHYAQLLLEFSALRLDDVQVATEPEPESQHLAELIRQFDRLDLEQLDEVEPDLQSTAQSLNEVEEPNHLAGASSLHDHTQPLQAPSLVAPPDQHGIAGNPGLATIFRNQILELLASM
jgi:hypothetical protein